jgi:hypothetical protein
MQLEIDTCAKSEIDDGQQGSHEVDVLAHLYSCLS